MRGKGPKLDSESVVGEKYGDCDSIQDKGMFFKRVILSYALLSYPMLCYGMGFMICYEISMI